MWPGQRRADLSRSRRNRETLRRDGFHHQVCPGGTPPGPTAHHRQCCAVPGSPSNWCRPRLPRSQSLGRRTQARGRRRAGFGLAMTGPRRPSGRRSRRHTGPPRSRGLPRRPQRSARQPDRVTRPARSVRAGGAPADRAGDATPRSSAPTPSTGDRRPGYGRNGAGTRDRRRLATPTAGQPHVSEGLPRLAWSVPARSGRR
jgi:hypothetical protein